MLSVLAIAAILTVQEADTGEAYRACAEIDGRRARLRCFDAAAADDPVRTAAAEAELEAARVAALDAAAAEAAADAAIVAADPADDSLAAAQARAADAERRAQEAEAALAAAEQRADSAERRAGPERRSFDEKVDALGFGADRTLIIRLEDGTVWRQIRDDRQVRESDLQRIERAYVTPAALGSWRMTLEPLGRSIKVRPRALDPRAGVDN